MVYPRPKTTFCVEVHKFNFVDLATIIWTECTFLVGKICE